MFAFCIPRCHPAFRWVRTRVDCPAAGTRHAQSSPGPNPPVQQVEIIIDGVRYTGTYTFRDGVITVTCRWGTEIGEVWPDAAAPIAARNLLREIVLRSARNGPN